MTRQDLDWIELNDFSPGIVHNLGHYVAGVPAGYGPGAFGAASIDETVGCIALPTGGLGPLPELDFDYIRPNSNSVASAANVDFSAYGPIGVTTSGPGRYSAVTGPHPVEFLIFIRGLTSVPSVVGNLYQDKVWKIAGAEILAANVQSVFALPSPVSQDVGPIICYFAKAALNPTTPTSPGNPCTIFAFPGAGQVGSDEAMVAFPDPTSPTSSVARDISTAARMNAVGCPVPHQNRIVLLDNRAVARGTATDSVLLNDAIRWSRPNTDVNEPSAPALFGPEQTYGFGTYCSFTSSDLLLIKHHEGGLLVQGDVNYPIVRRLPGIQGTAGQECDGAIGPGGFAYVVRDDGVYVAQGESSLMLSPQLPPEFWNPSDAFARRRPRLAWWGAWLLTPNGFLYSQELRSWWRLTTKAVYQWEVDPFSNYAYGMKSTVGVDGSGKLSDFLYGFNKGLGAHAYTWKSQPLLGQTNRMLKVRELAIVVQGTGTVAVTLQTSSGSQTETFTLSGSSTAPQVITKATAARDLDQVRVKIVATGGGATDPAPVVYRLRIGVEKGAQVNAE